MCLILFTSCFNPQDRGESGSRMVECTFREVGCLAAVHPDEMAGHLDTQIHYHTGVSGTSRVSHSSECFNTGQYAECALARALREKQRRNISLNCAVLLEELVAQNCDWIQNMPVPAGARNLHANVYRLALGHTQSLIPWIQALFPRGKAAGSWCWRRPLSSTKVENGCSCTSYSQFWFHGMDRDNFYFLLYKIFLLTSH